MSISFGHAYHCSVRLKFGTSGLTNLMSFTAKIWKFWLVEQELDLYLRTRPQGKRDIWPRYFAAFTIQYASLLHGSPTKDKIGKFER